MFQRMMNTIFQKLLYKNELTNYMDDFVIPGKTQEELKRRTIEFLKIAEKHNFCFKRSKCEFNATEISILGVKVENSIIQMETDKIDTI